MWAQRTVSLGIWSRLFLSGSQKHLCRFCKLHFGFRSLNSVAKSLAASRTHGGLERIHPKVPIIQWAALDASPDHGNTTWRDMSPHGFPHLTAQPIGTMERTVSALSPAGTRKQISATLLLHPYAAHHPLKTRLSQNWKAGKEGSLLEKGF